MENPQQRRRQCFNALAKAVLALSLTHASPSEAARCHHFSHWAFPWKQSCPSSEIIPDRVAQPETQSEQRLSPTELTLSATELTLSATDFPLSPTDLLRAAMEAEMLRRAATIAAP
jgi:hypothetical protein